MSYFDRYTELSTSQDIEQTLVESHNHLIQTIHPLTEEQMNFKYAEDKWSIKDLLQHLIDTERVFMYRAMCFARNDKTSLPSFDENEFAAEAGADLKSKDQLLNEYIAVHKSTIMFFNTLPKDVIGRKGNAGGNQFTIAQIAHIISGHIQHHLSVIEERYLPKL
ncbi:MAG: DinB family protein [Flavobacteriales bacterium]